MSKFLVAPGVMIDQSEIEERFILATGPGGQNVNKVASAVQLRFDVTACPSLSASVKERLIRLAGRKATREGVLIITARRFRAQEQNRQDARERLIALIKEAGRETTPRKPTKPTRAAKARRLDRKKKHSALKRQRFRPTAD